VAKENRNGVSVEILTAIAKRLRAKLVIQEDPFKRRLYLMKDGTIDLISGLLKRPEREEYIHFVHPPYMKRSDTVFFVQKKNASLIDTYADLYPLKIGTILGSQYFQQFDQDTRLHKEPVSGMLINFKKLLLGRLDTVILPEAYGIEQIHKMGITDKIVMARYRFSKRKEVYIGISKKSRLMDNINEIEAIIGSMIENKEIKKIIIEYYTRRNLPVPAH
jgi:polar amino acid transport system substrate-binding protein